MSQSLTILEDWIPHPKQAAALSCPATELFYGGAAGGGKSDFLLVDFLHGVNKGFGKHYQGILFRRTYDELDEIITRSFDLYQPLGAVYNQQKKWWTFPNSERIRFRYCESDRDILHYQGHQYQWIGWDELPQYPTDYPYRYMLGSRLRSAHGVPCSCRATGNPGGRGHAWIRNRFIANRDESRIWTDPETELTRCFIKARLEDNPSLMGNDPEYERRMKILNPSLYRAMREGDWNIRAGQVFEEYREGVHTCAPFAIPKDWGIGCSMDWGYAKPFSIGWWAVSPKGRNYRFREWYGCEKDDPDKGIRKDYKEVAKEAWEISAELGCKTMVADSSIWDDRDDGTTIAEAFEAAGFDMVKAHKDRHLGVQRVHSMLNQKLDDGKPALIVSDKCYAWKRTVPDLVADEKDPEDVDTDLEDHIYDETRYWLMSEYSGKPHLLRPFTVSRVDLGTQERDYDPLRHGA